MVATFHSPLLLLPAHTSEEAQPFRQDVGSLGLDENFAAVEGDAGTQFPADVEHGWFLQEQEAKLTPALCRVLTHQLHTAIQY